MLILNRQQVRKKLRPTIVGRDWTHCGGRRQGHQGAALGRLACRFAAGQSDRTRKSLFDFANQYHAACLNSGHESLIQLLIRKRRAARCILGILSNYLRITRSLSAAFIPTWRGVPKKGRA